MNQLRVDSILIGKYKYIFSDCAMFFSSAEESPKKKKVAFAEGTNKPHDDNIALSITRHEYLKEGAYTEYLIKVRLSNP